MITLDNYAQQSLGSYQQRYKEDYETVDEVNKRIMENLKIKQSSEAKKSTEEAKVPEPSSIQGMFCKKMVYIQGRLSASIKLGTPEPKFLQSGGKLTCSK